ncbi:MAG TPA: ribosome maturation factor RimM [Pyrinomonadaceae bacterium]|nr:ribosome maturation factor RimM [Pyrinomonadaceae bacterium]
MDELVVIARIVKTRGLKGELAAELLTDFPERFEGLDNVIGRLPNGEQRDLKIEKFWFQKGRVILKFAGFDTIESAEALRNSEVCVPEADAVGLDEDEFFDWQLAGCNVETVDGKAIGSVREVMRTGGTEILVVAGEEKEYLIPFAEAICIEVDIENKVIRVDPPEGLLDF